MVGNLEIGLTDGNIYRMMDYLGKGSVVGTYGILLNSDYVYSGKVRSPRVKVIKISFSTIMFYMK